MSTCMELGFLKQKRVQHALIMRLCVPICIWVCARECSYPWPTEVSAGVTDSAVSPDTGARNWPWKSSKCFSLRQMHTGRSFSGFCFHNSRDHRPYFEEGTNGRNQRFVNRTYDKLKVLYWNSALKNTSRFGKKPWTIYMMVTSSRGQQPCTKQPGSSTTFDHS